MTEADEILLDELRQLLVFKDETYKALVIRYDDLMKRYQDAQAELEWLRMDRNRE